MDTTPIQNLPLVVPNEVDKVVLSQNGNTRNATVLEIRGIINDLTTGGDTKTLSAEMGKLFKIYVDEELGKRYLKTETYTQEEITQKINDLIANAPDALNTLKELADALGDDANFATTITNLLANKVDKVTGKSLLSDIEITRLSTVTNYDHTNVDTHIANDNIHVTSTDKTNLANVVASSHTHSNKVVIDKFTEVGGNPYYNGSAIGGGGDAISINSKSVDNSTWSHGRVLTCNSTTGKDEWANITVTGIVGSTGNLVSAGANVSIPALSEETFTHPASTNDKIMINVQQQIIGSSVSDTHVDFSDTSKYILQDSGKIAFLNNTAQLKKQSDTNITPTTTGYSTIINSKTYTVTDNGSLTGFESWKTFQNPTLLGSLQWASSFTGSNYCQIDYGVGNERYFNRIDIGIYANSGDAKTVLVYGFKTDGTLTTLLSTCNLANTTGYQSFSISYVDKLRGIKFVISDKYALDANFRIMGIQLYSPNYPITPEYLKTTGTSDYSLTTTSSITSISSTVIIPTNTSVKVLFSVDNSVNWLYKDGTGIHKYTSDLTIAWTSSNQWSEISTYFTNLSITTLTSDLASLGIIPVTLDFAFDLNSTDLTVTPSVGKITLNYIETSHTELASFGGYGESTMFGVKVINPTTLGVKNNTSTAKIASVNVLLGTV